MYNGFNRDQKKRLMLKSYIPGIYSLMGPKRYYNTFFLKKLSVFTQLDRETPSYNSISKCVRLCFCRTKWQSMKETEAPALNVSMQAAQLSYFTSIARWISCC